MRNLKRVLSLALAAMMLMGMMVVSAGAASTYDNFVDKDEIVNDEAVNTIVSLGVMEGKPGDKFDPTATVKRGEMAKIIAKSLNGGKDPVLGDSTNIPKFSDVPADHWAYKYIAYCVQLGIIAGHGDGTFAPEAPVTGSQAAKMYLCALGYRADLEGLVGAEWELNTNILANQDAKLYEGLESINPSQGLNRDNTAQMCYNAIQADEVTYDNLQGSYEDVLQTVPNGTMLFNRFGVVKVEGVVVANDVFGLGVNAASEGKSMFRDTNTYRTSDNQVRNYNGVYPVDIPNEYVGQRVVIYVKFPNALAPNAVDSTVIGEPILSNKNTVATTGDRLKDADAVKSFLRDNGLSITNNDSATANDNRRYEGVKTLTAGDSGWNRDVRPVLADGVNGTAGRKMTFIDHTGDGTVDYIITENPTLAQVTVYNETDKELTIAGEGSLSFKEIANPEDVAKGDMTLYVKYDDTFYLTKPETVTGAVTAFVNGTPTKVTMDGTNYTQSANGLTATGTTLERLLADESLIGNSYVFYLDAYGNVIAKDLYEEEFGNYALVIDSASGTANGTNLANSGEVKLMLNDGTTAVYKVNMLASAARFGFTGTDDQKEAAMAAQLRATAGVKPLVGSIVTYVVDGGNVTIGNPAETTGYGNIKGGTTTPATDPVQRANASYDITWRDNAGTAHATNVIVNNNTLFYVMSDTDGNGIADRYSLIQGLSKVPQDDINGATVIAAAYRTRTVDGNTTNTAKAVVVWDANNDFKGSREFVYIIGNYTQTQDQIKNDIYEYPAVFENGEKTSILVKNGTTATDEVNNVNVTIRSGNIYEYRMNGDYAELFLTNSTWNNQVTSQVSGKSMQVRLGTNGADKHTHTLGTTVINVEDSDKVYVMDSAPSAAMSVAYGLDSDGKVSLIFVRDSDVHFRNVYNWTNSTMKINGVDVAAGQPIAVANGFDITVPGTAGAKLVGYADYDGSKTDEYLRSTISSTTALGTITMPANADVKIGSTNGTASTTFNLTDPSKNTGSGSSTTPSGEYTITFYSSEWSGKSFYVNGTKVTTFTEGVGTKSFTVKSADTVTIDGFTITKEGSTMTVADGVVATTDKRSGSVSFKVSSNVTLYKASDITEVGGTTPEAPADIASNITSVNLTLQTADGTKVEGGKVTQAKLNASNYLEVKVALPEGYTSSETAVVTWVSNNISNSVSGMQPGSTTKGVYTGANNSALNATLGVAENVTLNITLKVSAITEKPVTYKLPSGYTLDGTGTNTQKLDTAAAGNLEFKLMGAPAYAAKVDVSYTVTGTNLNSAKTYTASGLAVSNLQITVPSVKATGDVVVTVTEVKVTDVKAEIKLADGVPANLIAFNGGAKTMTVGSAAKLANMDATLPANVNKATVSYTVTGATGSKLTGTFDVVSSTVSNQAWITDDFTPTGDQAVVVTIDSVTYTEAKAAAINTAALGTVDSGKTITVGIKNSPASIKLQKSGDTYTNAEALTITLTPNSAWSATGVKIQLSGATNGSIADSANVVSTATGGADTSPVEITFQAGDLTFNDLSKAIQFVVEDNT